jgi:Ca2+-binding RTX toxin-like protein
MTTYVTVPGASSTFIVNPYNNVPNLAVAQSIANALAAAQTGSTLSVQPYSTSLPSVPSGETGEIAVTSPTSGFIQVPGGYTFTAIGPTTQGGSSPPGPFTVAGGGSLFVGNQATTYYGSAATAVVSIAAGDGNDLISLPSGSTYEVGLGNGNDTVYADGTGTVTGGTGNNIFFTGSTSGPNTINSYGAADTIVAGVGTVSVNTYGANPLVFGGSGNLVYLGSAAGSPTITGGTGKETLFGGSGQNLTYQDGSNTVAGANILAAGAGNETLNAGSAQYGVQLAAGSGSVDMIGSKGPDTFYGGSGFATMTGNGGADSFIFGNTTGHTGGTDIITDFNSSDNFVTANYGAGAAQTALNNATVTGGNTFIKLTDGTSIEFLDVANPSTIRNQSF